MAQWREDTVMANGIHVHYTQAGELTKPAIILLHGVTDSGLCWTHVAHALEQDYRVIMPDARGHGRSDRVTGEFSTEMLADDVAGLIQVLQLEEPILLGHSMGGMTALTVAARYPNLVRAILLEDPPIIDRSPQQAEAGSRSSQMVHWLTGLKAMTRDELLVHVRADNPTWPEEDYVPWVDSKIDVDPAVFQSIAGISRSWRELAADITCPVLLVIGDVERRAIVTPEAAQEALRYWAQGKVVHIAEAGHNIRRDNYPDFMHAVQAFLSTIR
ncbi:alpha/beta hydrolase [Dictyobacter alpinus]|uniref:Alpha/beta hydrolase n=1 Tax=Dictyobacter alpinus TaxID=2014873 RepID=A0A402BHA8_9CHLR|nr:alpha/beta hydrolase [Dictyobacter alpinus]GCE30763.1 alpha/beta hydrolase [Dictyobacter alpinus]